MLDEMKEDEKGHEPCPDLDDYLDETVGDAIRSYQRRKLILWVIRTTIGVLLFGWLAKTYPWGKWVLIAWIPLAILSLVAIIVLPKHMGSSLDHFDGEEPDPED